MVSAPRKGAARVADVPQAILEQLNAGEIEAATLSENLAMDFAVLLRAILPELADEGEEIDRKAGITKRMTAAAGIISARFGMEKLPWLAAHRSDIVRGWGAYLIALDPALTLPDRVKAMLPFANDPHFGVREWAWLALRPHLVKAPHEAIAIMAPLAHDPSAYLRRFACESIRPRGVWSAHIPLLKEHPAQGLAAIEPLRADPARYVQDSVANWLNDAWKSAPDWVEALCHRWEAESPRDATRYVIRRALRNKSAR